MNILSKDYEMKLLKKWKPLLESGAKIDSQRKVALAKVLESTEQDFKRRGLLVEGGMGTTDGGIGGFKGDGVLRGLGDKGDFNWPTIVMPMLRRIFPTLMAHELVGVQPLNGPIGYAMALRAVYGQDGGDVGDKGSDEFAGKEIGYNNVLTQFTGKQTDPTAYTPASLQFSENPQTSAVIFNITKGDEAGATDEEKQRTTMWKAYAGAEATADAVLNFIGQGQETATGEWASLGKNYPTVQFNLIKKAVDAKTRKLAANWSPELAEDMQAMHGIDVEKEMMSILSYEIGAEIDRQIITEMVAAAILGGECSTWSAKLADGLDQMGRLATLLTHITVEAQQIAIRSRRGNANFVIASPKVTAVLQQLTANKFVAHNEGASMPSVPKPGVGSLTKVGLINDGQQLLIRDTFAGGDYALLGFKGTTPGDAGIIYCPYIPIQLAKIPYLSDNFTPAIGARTRYGMMSTPWDAKNYYHMVKIDGLDNAATYQWGGDRVFLQNNVNYASGGPKGTQMTLA